MAEKQTWDLMSLASIPLVMTLGNSMLIPVLPTIQKQLKISSLQVSMIITVYSIVAIILIPIAGYLSDRYGRKRIIIPSLLIAAFGGLISGWSAWQINNPYEFILFGRLLQGIGAAGAAPIVMPFIGDIFQNDNDVSNGLGLIETANTFGKVLSPILGAILAAFIWFMPFFAFPIFCLISIFMTLFLVKSPSLSTELPKLDAFWRSIKYIFKTEGTWLYAVFIIGCICMFILFGVLFYLSTMLEEQHHINGIKKGIILAIPLAALCFSSYLTGKIIGKEKMKMKLVTAVGMVILSIANISVAFSNDIYVLLTAMFASGLGIGFALPSLDALVTEGIAKEERGTITSIYSSMRFVGVALGPPIVAIVMKNSHFMLFALISLLSIVTLLITIVFIKPSENDEYQWS